MEGEVISDHSGATLWATMSEEKQQQYFEPVSTHEIKQILQPETLYLLTWRDGVLGLIMVSVVHVKQIYRNMTEVQFRAGPLTGNRILEDGSEPVFFKARKGEETQMFMSRLCNGTFPKLVC